MSIRNVWKILYSGNRPIPRSKFPLVPTDTVSRLLKNAVSKVDNTEAAATIQKLKQISPSAAEHLKPKSCAIENLRFRVLRTGLKRNATAKLNSFVALSYRWQEWRSTRSSKGFLTDGRSTEDEVATPVSSPMLKAALDELKCDDEGLWFDQGCIRQGDKSELNNAIGAMDLIYQSARLVVVALDDVTLDERECRFLTWFESDIALGEKTPAGKTRTTPNRFFRHTGQQITAKIMNSEYFSRAWCRHEFLLAKKRIFLLNVASSSKMRTPRIFRLSDKGLEKLVNTANSPVLFGGRISEKWGQRVMELAAYYTSLSTLKDLETKRELQTNFVRFMFVILNVCELETGGSPNLPAELRASDGNTDKMAIALNGANTSIILDRTAYRAEDYSSMTEAICIQRLLLLTLAQGNPLVLCARGQALQVTPCSYSWLSKPHRMGSSSVDMFRDELPPLDDRWALRVDPSPACLFVDIDLVPFKRVRTASEATPEALNLAEEIVALAGKLATDAQTGLGTREILARLIDAGEGYIPCANEKILTGHDAVGVDPGENPLLKAFKSLLTDDWKSLRQSGQLSEPSREEAARVIWSYIFAVTTQNFIPYRPRRARYGPAWIMIWLETASQQRVITCAPADDDNLLFAVPAALSRPEYADLPRCWVLKQEISNANASTSCGHRWALQAKIKLAESFDLDLEDEASEVQHLRVYGPSEVADKENSYQSLSSKKETDL